MVAEVLPPHGLAGRTSLAGRVLLSAVSPAEIATGETLSALAITGADYLELDVQRTADGALVLLATDAIDIGGVQTPVDDIGLETLEQTVGPLLTYEAALDAVAHAGRRLHLHLRFASPTGADGGLDLSAVAAVTAAAARVRPGDLLVTSGHDTTVLALRWWSVQTQYPLLVGLRLGAGPKRRHLGVYRDLRPAKRLAACGANIIAVPGDLTHARIIDWAWRHGRIPALVFGVDRRRDLARLFSDRRVWAVSTVRPDLAPVGRPTRRAPSERIATVVRVLLATGWIILLVLLVLILNMQAHAFDREPVEHPKQSGILNV